MSSFIKKKDRKGMSKPNKTILLTGVSGLFGANAVLEMHEKADWVGVVNRHPINLPGLRVEKCNLLDSADVLSLIERVKPDHLIHAAAEANVDRCEDHREEVTQLNVEVPRFLAQACRDREIHFTHFSTDAFFDREGYVFKEEDEPCPVNFYGETKARSERAVLKENPQALIVRVNFFGWSPVAQRRLNLGEWIVTDLMKNEKLQLFGDVIFTPLYAAVLGRAVTELSLQKASGIYHVVGDDTVSKLEFGQRLCRRFGLNEELIIPSRLEEVKLTAPRVRAMALSNEKLKKALPDIDLTLDTGIEQFYQAMKSDVLTHLKGDEAARFRELK